MSCPEKRPPTVVDRYFSKHYRIDLQKKASEDVCILTHSNKICIVTLAPSHPVLAGKKEVTKVNFNVGGANRLDNKTSGKSKRGAQWLGSLAPMCSLVCGDGTSYTICCGVKGQLIEANSALVDNPQLVTQDPWSTGFLGIMLPALKGHEAEMARLLTEAQYQQAVRARSPDDSHAAAVPVGVDTDAVSTPAGVDTDAASAHAGVDAAAAPAGVDTDAASIPVKDSVQDV
ncbi:hypothetical protein ACOMHN_065620 [Nucella lapillus]